MLGKTLKYILGCAIILQLIAASAAFSQDEEYLGFGSLGIALRPVQTGQTLWWISTGNWRAEADAGQGGVGSAHDITYMVTVNRANRTLLIEGDTDGFLRDAGPSFDIVGNLRIKHTYLVEDIDFEIDPVTGLEIFAIGRTAFANGTVEITSPDNSVTFDGPSLTINITDKYLQPNPNVYNHKKYGPFLAAPFNTYVGPRHFDVGDLFFTGTGDRGVSAWIMSEENVRINGIWMLPPNGDYHGDLVPRPAPLCEFESYCELNPAYPGCLCTIKPEDPACICENDPNAIGCECAVNPFAPGCACDIDPTAPGCICNYDPSAPECKCGQDNPNNPACSCETNPFAFGCTCFAAPGTLGCNNPLGQGYDRCGECEGNGLGCCEEEDIGALLLEIDNNGHVLKNYVRKLARIVRKLPPRKNNKKIAKNAVQVANESATAMWQTINMVPTISFVCETVGDACVSVSLEEDFATLAALEAKMRKEKNRLRKIVKRSDDASTKQKRKAKKLGRKYNNLAAENEAMIASIPVNQSVCID